MELAVTLIKKKTGKFDAADFDDFYETALHELIERKLKKLPLEKENTTSKVVNLMNALKRSLDEGKQKAIKKRQLAGKQRTRKVHAPNRMLQKRK